MSLISGLIELDKSIFLNMNGCHSAFFDNFFWLVTGVPIWIPLYVVILYMIIKSQPRGWWITLIALGVLITLCDQVSNNLLKEGIERLRPSREPSLDGLVHVIAGYKGGKFGFVSSHAANSFGLALFTTLLIRQRWFGISIFAWAALNSYSRIYVGVHYPGDILGGMIVGLIIAIIIFWTYQKVLTRLMRDWIIEAKPGNTIGITVDVSAVRLTIFTLLLSVLIMLIAASLYLKMIVQ